MDQIQHKYIGVRGLNLHIAEIGTGTKVVLFIHGFPEIWYSWRHQMIAVSNAGYRAIAPDLRGYGLSEHHPQPEGVIDFVEDAVAILDSLQIHKAFLIGKDFGSWACYLLSLLHPTRVSGIVSLGMPFFLPKRQELPEGFYTLRWKEPGRTQADFGRFDAKTVWKNIYILFSGSELPVAEKDEEIMDLVNPSSPLPPWLTEEDVAIYTTSYEKSGFDSPMLIPYRSPGEIPPISNSKIEVPVLLIMGGKDYCLKVPGIENGITSGEVKEYASDLEIKFLSDGTHFIQEQFPDQVNELIIRFINNKASDQY